MKVRVQYIRMSNKVSSRLWVNNNNNNNDRKFGKETELVGAVTLCAHYLKISNKMTSASVIMFSCVYAEQTQARKVFQCQPGMICWSASDIIFNPPNNVCRQSCEQCCLCHSCLFTCMCTVTKNYIMILRNFNVAPRGQSSERSQQNNLQWKTRVCVSLWVCKMKMCWGSKSDFAQIHWAWDNSGSKGQMVISSQRTKLRQNSFEGAG